MPIYVFKCPRCLKVYDLTKPMARRDESVYCLYCAPARVKCARQMTSPAGLIVR